MKYVNSGSGKIPLITLIAILSISLTVNLPGLAVSPLLGKLKDVFPNVSELETQLLVVLPNFVIIPFILCAGKICNLKNQIRVLALGLIIYIVSGILFLFANSMAMLIILSCLLGVGCGLVIPLAASLIAQNFRGKERTRQLGMKSGVSNFTVIFATLFVGWIASVGWHMAFLVYLVPVIPLCLLPFMTNKFIDEHSQSVQPKALMPSREIPASTISTDCPHDIQKTLLNQNIKSNKKVLLLLLGVIGLYVAMTFTTMAISDYLPFTMKHYKMNTSEVGVATAFFFLAATCAGFSLTWVLNSFKRMTPYLALTLCALGMFACGFIHEYYVYLIAIFMFGFGYGLMQPIIYDKTALIATTPQKSTEYFSYTLTGNYVAIALAPFIVDLLAGIFHTSTLNFPYILCGVLLLTVMCIGVIKCRSFVFDMSDLCQPEEIKEK